MSALKARLLQSNDENRHPYSLKAPGPSSGSGMRLPGRGSFPGVDDRLVIPEYTRDEIIGGRRVVASPAAAPHAIRHGDLQYLLRAHVAVGYLAAVDLLTPHAEDSDLRPLAPARRRGREHGRGARLGLRISKDSNPGPKLPFWRSIGHPPRRG